MKTNRFSLRPWKVGTTSFLKRFKIPSGMIFVILGLLSTLWMLVRLIPKPSRIQYPCMKATMPMAYSFISYVIGITGFTFLFKKARERFYQARYLWAGIFICLGLVAGVWTVVSTNRTVKANTVKLQGLQESNAPVGTAKGIFPGRVVWVFDPDVTDETCANVSGDYWYLNTNTDQSLVNAMLSKGLKSLTGGTTDAEAWNNLFRHFNENHGKGQTGYTAGEKITIKINLNGQSHVKNINTSPQICLAILDQLVNTVGVAQSNISIGDPYCPMADATYNPLKAAFPNVIYWGNEAGRTQPTKTTSPVLFSSDDSDDKFSNALPQAYVNADYMINIPVFKKHHRAGISLGAKNHFGTIGAYAGGAWHMHYSLPCPEADGDVANGEYGLYRCFVDIMGHKDLGGKTILYLVDGIWGSVNWGHPPVKWRMAPFNTDWPSSLFLSQDPVAIESVGYDFLYHEFDENHPSEGLPFTGDKGPFPRFAATDDYLHQAADPANWPAGISYDPENDGTVLTSLGTHEHWNNPYDRKYSRNLGTGNGIELYFTSTNPAGLDEIKTAPAVTVYPNPVTERATIQFNLDKPGLVFLEIYSPEGRLVETLNQGQLKAGPQVFNWIPESKSGLYIGSLSVAAGGEHYNKAFKIRVE